MPGMYITVLRGPGINSDKCHERVKSPIYPHTDIAYFVFSVVPGKGAMVKDCAHNNSYFIAEDEIGDYELVENYMSGFDHLDYINEFLTGRFSSDIAWFEKN